MQFVRVRVPPSGHFENVPVQGDPPPSGSAFTGLVATQDASISAPSDWADLLQVNIPGGVGLVVVGMLNVCARASQDGGLDVRMRFSADGGENWTVLVDAPAFQRVPAAAGQNTLAAYVGSLGPDAAGILQAQWRPSGETAFTIATDGGADGTIATLSYVVAPSV